MNRNKPIIIVCIVLAVLAGVIFCLSKWLNETADARQAEKDMAELRLELTDRDAEPVLHDDGIYYIEYNPYTPYFLGHDEFFCWMQMPDTPIDYPVAQAPEDDPYFYLSHNFTGRTNRYGCPFVEHEQSEDDDILFIYAHNNANATMFGTFIHFNDSDYFNEHFSMTLDFADVQRTYEIIGVMDISANDTRFDFWDTYNFNSELTEDLFLNEINAFAAIRRYTDFTTLDHSDQYVLMLTCEYTHSHGRRVVIAREINETPYDPEVNAEIIARER